MKSNLLPWALLLGAAGAARADFAPIALTPASYNQDGIIELAIPHVTHTATTATVDNGTGNNGFTWYEVGYNTNNPSTGVPAVGSSFASVSQTDHFFQMAPTYTTNNAFLIDSRVTSAVMKPATASAFSSLSFLGSSGGGNMTVAYTVHHADGSTDTGTIVSPDWFGGGMVAYYPLGRVDAVSRSFQTWGSGVPEIFSMDVALANTTSPVTSIDLSYSAGSGHACILGVSGSTGGNFNPITVSGFNQDMIVEANAEQAPVLNGAYTTVSMDNGQANTGFSWFEQGFVYGAPNTGVPKAGTTITNVSANDHTYKMAASYAGSDVIYIDNTIVAGSPAVVTPATPATFSTLSFLGAAGHGPVVVDCVINHADGSSETGSISVPDWFGSGTKGWVASGRIDVQNAGVQTWGSGGPTLFSMDVPLNNTASPVTSINLSYSAANTGYPGQAMILAVSGAAGATRPSITAQPMATNSVVPGNGVQFSVTNVGTAPFTYRWQKLVNGSAVNLTDGGHIAGSTTATLTVSPVAATDGGQYQVVISNGAGSTTSSPALLNLVSSLQDVTAQGDLVEVYNGGQGGGNEGVYSAIDNTTQKYLNVSSPSGGFVGPVGLVVTPSMGSSLVTGLRIYTANDAPERDPADFTLEGSNDGTTFTPIASGNLMLPDDRNPSGLYIDPLANFNQEVDFANHTAYTTYRVSFNHVKSGQSNNLLQIAEVELLGGPAVSVTIQPNGSGGYQLTWPQGQLLEAPSINGPWTTNTAAFSPFTISPTGPQKFYRVLVQ